MMVHGLRLCCWCRLEERVVRLELHDLELRRGRLGRLDSDWRGYGHWSRYIGGLRNASGQARIGGCKEVLLLRRVAQFFVLGGGQLLGQQGLLDSWRSGLLLHAIGDGQLFVLNEVRCVKTIDQLVNEHLVGQLDLGAADAVSGSCALLVLVEGFVASPLLLEDLLQFDVLLAPLSLLVVLARVDVTRAIASDHAALDALRLGILARVVALNFPIKVRSGDGNTISVLVFVIRHLLVKEPRLLQLL